MNKTQLLNWLLEEEQKWTLLLAAIGDTRLNQLGVNGDWMLKDMIAHLTGWQRHLVAKLRAAADGQPEPAPAWPSELTDEDEINAWIYTANRHKTAQQIVADAADVHQHLLIILRSLPEDARVETIDGKFHVIWVREQRFALGEFFHHFYDDHATDVLNWLSQTD